MRNAPQSEDSSAAAPEWFSFFTLLLRFAEAFCTSSPATWRDAVVLRAFSRGVWRVKGEYKKDGRKWVERASVEGAAGLLVCVCLPEDCVAAGTLGAFTTLKIHPHSSISLVARKLAGATV